MKNKLNLSFKKVQKNEVNPDDYKYKIRREK